MKLGASVKGDRVPAPLVLHSVYASCTVPLTAMLNALRFDDLWYSTNLAINHNCKRDLPSSENCGAILPGVLRCGRGSLILKSLRPFNAPSLLVSK